MTLKRILGILGGVITVAGFIPYIVSIFAGSTHPSLATWWIWTLNSGLCFYSWKSSGAKESIWLSVGYAIGCVNVAIIALWFGASGWTVLDTSCLVGGVLAAILWWLTGSPLPTFLMTLVIDLIGVTPTICKSWSDPKGENLLSWLLFFFGGLISLSSVERWALDKDSFIEEWGYPMQITVTAAIVVIFLLR